MDARLQRFQRYSRVGKGRRRDCHGVELRQEFAKLVTGERLDAVLRRQGFGSGAIEIVDADKVDIDSGVGRLAVFIGVVAAKNTRARNPHTQNLRHNRFLHQTPESARS